MKPQITYNAPYPPKKNDNKSLNTFEKLLRLYNFNDDTIYFKLGEWSPSTVEQAAVITKAFNKASLVSTYAIPCSLLMRQRYRTNVEFIDRDKHSLTMYLADNGYWVIENGLYALTWDMNDKDAIKAENEFIELVNTFLESPLRIRADYMRELRINPFNPSFPYDFSTDTGSH